MVFRTTFGDRIMSFIMAMVFGLSTLMILGFTLARPTAFSSIVGILTTLFSLLFGLLCGILTITKIIDIFTTKSLIIDSGERIVHHIDPSKKWKEREFSFDTIKELTIVRIKRVRNSSGSTPSTSITYTHALYLGEETESGKLLETGSGWGEEHLKLIVKYLKKATGAEVVKKDKG